MVAGFEWFVAWRYLRATRGRHALWPVAVGLLLLAGAATCFAMGSARKPPTPAQIAMGAQNWKQIYLAGGLGLMVLGMWWTVFGIFYRLQSIFTTISTFGVFLGTWALTIALSVMNGFEVDLRQKILGSNAHVLVSMEEGEFTEWRAVEAKLAEIPGVVAYTRYGQSEVVIAANSNYSGVIIKGIDPRTVGSVTDLGRNLLKDRGRVVKLEDMWPIGPDAGVLPDAGDDDDGEPPDLSGEEPDAGTGDDDTDGDADDEPPDLSGGDDEVDAGPGRRPDAGSGAGLGRPRPPTRFAHDPDATPGTAGGIGLERWMHDPEIIDLGSVGSSVLDGETGRKVRERLDPRIASLDGILVGKELAKNLHLYIGQEVQVVSPIGQDTPTGQVPRVRNFRVAGIFFTGMYEYDTKFAYVTVPALQSFLSMGEEVSGIEIKIVDQERTEPVVRAIQQALGPAYRVQDWKEINRSLFSALKLEKIAMFLVLTIIILVASFSIVSNLIMVVVEKAREIAILKAIGAADPGVMRVFMIEGLYIGGLGTMFGLGFGMVTCFVLEVFGLPLDPEVYYIDKLPVAMDLSAIGLVAAAGVAISFVATIYPSYLAARMRPVDGLRYE